VPRLPESTRDAVKQAIDIVSLAGEYGLQLHRSGSKFKALCPFHDDHNPSLILDPDRQSYKCWACGAGGDVLSFVQAYERVEFPEALRMLAERAGIALTPESPAGAAHATADGPSRADLRAACDWAAREFAGALAQNDEARAYLERRRISPSSVERFGLGFAPDRRDWLSARARSAGFGLAALEAAGLVSRREEGSSLTFDRFRGRLMFPIRDLLGRTIGFGGRILPSVEEKILAESGRKVAKYLNSPETPLFQKRRNLYAADLARAAARQEGWVAVVEGYTDVIAAHQVGLENVVATLGTALGDEHVGILRRLADRVVLVFDGDEAGQKAADRSLEIFLGHEVDVRVLTLPERLDPCDFLLAEGDGPFRQMVDAALDPVDFALERAAERFDFDSIDDARRAADWVLGLLVQIKPKGGMVDLKVDKALDRLASRLRIPLADVKRHLRRLRQAAARKSSASTAPEPVAAPDVSSPERARPAPAVPVALDPTERELAAILLDDPAVIALLARRITPNLLREGPIRTLMAEAFEIYAEGELPSFDRLAPRLDETTRAVAAGLNSGLEAGPLPHNIRPAARETLLPDLLAALAERDRRERLRDVDAALREVDPTANPQEYQALWRERLRLANANPTPKKPPTPTPTPTTHATASPKRPEPRNRSAS
jgi:DNA primase